LNAARYAHSGFRPSVGWQRHILLRAGHGLTWRRAGTVLVLCLVLSTHILAQPDLFEYWSLEHIVEGWACYFVEVGLSGFAMLAGFAVAEEATVGSGPQRAMAVAMGANEADTLGDGLLLLIEGAYISGQLFGLGGPAASVARNADLLIEASLKK